MNDRPPGKWAKLRGLTYRERWLLCRLALLLPCTAIGLRLFGLERFQRLLSRFTPSAETDRVDWKDVRAVARLVDAAADHGPYRAACLKRSVLLWWLLRRRGWPCELRIGVRKAESSDSSIEAHAWVEMCGRVLNDRADIASRFAPFGAPVGPARSSSS